MFNLAIQHNKIICEQNKVIEVKEKVITPRRYKSLDNLEYRKKYLSSDEINRIKTIYDIVINDEKKTKSFVFIKEKKKFMCCKNFNFTIKISLI